MTIEVDITEDLLQEAVATHDPLDLDGRRDEEQAWDDAVRARIVELAFERAYLEPYYKSKSWKQFPDWQVDYRIETELETLDIEIKARDSFRLDRKGIVRDEADLPVRMRDGKLHADRYVLAIIHDWDRVEFVGVVNKEDVQQAEWADWTERPSKEVLRADVRSLPTP